MSYKEVNSLRKAGNLNEALRLAESDLQVEQSHWTYSALFWVLRDYCNQYLAQKQNQCALSVLHRMESIKGNINDHDGVVESTFQSLKRQSTPLWEDVNKLSELSKNGQEESAYIQICELNRNNTLSPLFHEDFGWIIYRYLKKHYESCGSLNARKVLHSYLQLRNARPSVLHSQILFIAIKISEKYSDFIFISFLKIWDVKCFTSEDLCRKILLPFDKDYGNFEHLKDNCLVEKCIEHCFMLGCRLNDIKDCFMKNEQILEDDIYRACSRSHFFDIYISRDNEKEFFTKIDNYLTITENIPIKNEFHSKVLALYLWKLPENSSVLAVPAINKWGLGNFRSEDWKREKKDEKEFPSLVEKVIKHYFAGLKLNQFNNVESEFESLLEKASKEYEDDQLERDLAILTIAKGNKEKALSIYRSLLLRLNRFYVWKELAEATDDIELKISAYCMAIVSEPKDEFLGDVHLALAKLMIDEGAFPEAKRELQTYADTHNKNRWRLKDDYYVLSSQVANSTIQTESNIPFYELHMASAENFVYSDIDWTTMFVADVYVQRDGEKHIKKAKLVSADGIAITINYEKLTTSNDNCIGKCFHVKIHSKDGKKEIVLIKDSDSRIEQLLSPVVCYVDYHNKERKNYYLISETEKELLLSHAPSKLDEGTFCRCFEVPEIKEKNNNEVRMFDWDAFSPTKKTRPMKAIFYDIIKDYDALERFPIETAVVDNINESKELFHCVFGRDSDIIIKYNQTTIRPQIGDYVRIRYAQKKSKEGKNFRKMLTIETTDTCDKVLKKAVTGLININTNSEGKKFGFVDDYYVPTRLLEGINVNELVYVDLVFNGEKWQTYNIMNYSSALLNQNTVPSEDLPFKIGEDGNVIYDNTDNSLDQI